MGGSSSQVIPRTKDVRPADECKKKKFKTICGPMFDKSPTVSSPSFLNW